MRNFPPDIDSSNGVAPLKSWLIAALHTATTVVMQSTIKTRLNSAQAHFAQTSTKLQPGRYAKASTSAAAGYN